MRRNSTKYVCVHGLAAAVLLCIFGETQGNAWAARVRDSRPADVMVYVTGDDTAPGSVDYGARAIVTWMFARAGVRLAWRDGELGRGAPSRSPVLIQVRFTGEGSGEASRGALAYALPFGDGATAITVMYDRIRWVAGRSTREQLILAYTLAHEIGHILERTNWHAQTGIMKAHWSGQDYDATERKQLGFTSDDVDLIIEGAERAESAKRQLVTGNPPVAYELPQLYVERADVLTGFAQGPDDAATSLLVRAEIRSSRTRLLSKLQRAGGALEPRTECQRPSEVSLDLRCPR